MAAFEDREDEDDDSTQSFGQDPDAWKQSQGPQQSATYSNPKDEAAKEFSLEEIRRRLFSQGFELDELETLCQTDEELLQLHNTVFGIGMNSIAAPQAKEDDEGIIPEDDFDMPDAPKTAKPVQTPLDRQATTPEEPSEKPLSYDELIERARKNKDGQQ